MRKLVRDRIPEIINNSGKVAVYEVMCEEEYKKYLDKKLQEEVEEYLESGEVEEICDVLEVLYAIIEEKGISRDEVEKMRDEKRHRNGAFRNKYLLKEIRE